MPRMPKPHECDCHIPVNASEDIKLKILEAKLREELGAQFILKDELKTLNNETLSGTGDIHIKNIKEVKEISHEGLIHTYQITFEDEHDTPYIFIVTDGEKGDKGEPGEQGPQGPQGPVGPAGTYIAGENISIQNNTISAAMYDDTLLKNKVSNIEERIPEQATVENKLADKNFVNSSIQAMAADYITASASGDSFINRATLLAGPYYHAGVIVQPKNNDYAIVAQDEQHENKQCRYCYQNNAWSYQYSINTTFTANQQAAIDSGATSELIAQITVNKNDILNKQETIDDLALIRSGASLGATAVQPSAINDMATKTWVDDQGYLTQHQSLADYSTTTQMNAAISNYHDSSKQDKLTQGTNINISSTGVISAIDTKYTAGENIIISADNVISSIGGGQLKEALTASIQVGGIPAGTTFAANTKIEEILRKMLCITKTLEFIYIATQPTKVEYTAGETFNPAGMVVKAHYTVGEDEVITEYSYEPTRCLTTSDNKITISYQGKTVEQIISVHGNTVSIYKGLCNIIPTTETEIKALTLDDTKSKTDLLASPYTCKRLSPNNQFVVLAIPKSAGIYVDKIKVSDFGIGFNEIEVDNYYLYTEDNPATLSNVTYEYVFEEV